MSQGGSITSIQESCRNYFAGKQLPRHQDEETAFLNRPPPPSGQNKGQDPEVHVSSDAGRGRDEKNMERRHRPERKPSELYFPFCGGQNAAADGLRVRFK